MSIIRNAVEEILQAPAACNFDPSHPQPIFLGLEERRKEREHAMTVEVADFDIDEGGPLREEYIPKRRASGTGSVRSGSSSRENIHDNAVGWARPMEHVKALPPPAKWSPAGDEPILRDRNRGGAHYVAVQPSAPYHVVPYTHDVRYQPHWPASYMHAAMPMAYAYDSAHLQPLPVYGPLAFALPVSHSRSQSHYSYQDNSEPHNHLRSYSQSHYRCDDMRMAQDVSSPTRVDGPWDRAHQARAPVYAPHAPHPAVHFQSTWLRA